jgi:hypothetical protein
MCTLLIQNSIQLIQISVTLSGVIILILVAVFVLFFFKLLFHHYMIWKCKKQEKWLPVVDDAGNIIGRVAKSVSLEEPGKFQHPLIRVIVLCNGLMYLKVRGSDSVFEKGKVDHPFEIMIEFGKSIEETIEAVSKRISSDCTGSRFIIKYRHENDEGKWQVLLYAIELTDENQLGAIDSCDGKLWTIKQIRENIGKSYFSNIFEGEIDFLSTIVDR